MNELDSMIKSIKKLRLLGMRMIMQRREPTDDQLKAIRAHIDNILDERKSLRRNQNKLGG